MSLSQELTFTSPLIESSHVAIDTVPTDYTVILGYHGSAADIPIGLRDTYANADIALQEQIGWQPQEVSIRNDLSFAPDHRVRDVTEYARECYFNNPTTMKMLRIITGTKAQYGFWDVEAGHPEFYDQVDGRTHGVSNFQELTSFTDTLIRSDELALSALAGRIKAADQRPIKGEKRNVVLQAGMAHVLLYNGLRHAVEATSDSTVSLQIAFDEYGFELKDQHPSVIALTTAVSEVQVKDGEIEAAFAFSKKIQEVGMPRKASHVAFKQIWEVLK